MQTPHTTDTIVAISTPPGRGGIGIVRLSGPAAISTAQHLLRLAQPLAHAQARFARILDDNHTAIDEAVVTAFHRPHSYTGEDLVEIAAHGSPVVLDYIVGRALSRATDTHPVRLADPGEFSRRAFLAGRLDLTQAEAIHDLIAAQTLAQARTAAQQLGGSLSRRVAPIKTGLLHLIAMLEAGMDFATGELDDVDTMPPARVAAALLEIQGPLEALAGTFRTGALQRDGARLALVGRPNAGKSSLFNRLLARDRSIVTATPGTTRDTIEETLALDGIPIRLVDTAGLRTPAAGAGSLDEAETQGIARSREALAEADLILLVQAADELQTLQPLQPLQQIDSSETHTDPGAPPPATSTWVPADLDVSTRTLLEDRPTLRIRNKIDLTPNAPEVPGEIQTSALTGQGVDTLRAAILAHLRAGTADAAEATLNNMRQHGAVLTTLTALDAATQANAAHLPHELLLLDLHAALTALDTLTGTTTTDDILGLIFSTFCIGK